MTNPFGCSPFVNKKQAAQWLNISRAQIDRVAKAGKLDVRDHGGKKVILFESLVKFSESSALNKESSQSKFEGARVRLRSLKTGNASTTLSSSA